MNVEATEPDTVWTVNCWPGTVNCVKFFPDGTKFVNNAGSYVQIRETTTGKLLNQFIHQSPEIKSIDVTKDGKYVFASGTGTNYIGMWDVETGEERRFIDDTMYTEIKSMSLSPDNKKIVAILINGGNLHWAIIMWDVETGKVLNKVDELYGEWRKVKFFNKSNKFVIDKGLKPCRIFIYDALNFKVIKELNNPFDSNNDGIQSCDFSENDEYLAAIPIQNSSDTPSVKIWNLNDFSTFSTIKIGYKEMRSVKFSKNSESIYIGGVYYSNKNYFYFIYSTDLIEGKFLNKFDITNVAKLCICEANDIDAKIESNQEQILYGGRGGLVLLRNRQTDVSGENFPNNNYELIYPNPSSDFIEISRVEGEVRIYNFLGIEESTPALSATPQEGNLKINVSGLAPGLYFVRFGDKVGKFIKL